MTYIAYVDVENGNLLIHKFPCEKLENFHANKGKYKEFSELDYVEKYAEDNDLKTCYCRECNPKGKSETEEIISDANLYLQNNKPCWIETHEYSFADDGVEFELSQNTVLICYQRTIPVVVSILYGKLFGWVIRITFQSKILRDEESADSPIIGAGRKYPFYSFAKQNKRNGFTVCDFDIEEPSDSESLAYLLHSLQTDEYMKIGLVFGTNKSAILPLAGNLKTEIDISLEAMKFRCRERLYTEIYYALYDVPELQLYFQNLTKFNIVEKMSEALLQSCGIEELDEKGKTKYMRKSGNNNVDFFKFFYNRLELQGDSREEAASFMLEAHMAAFSSLFTYQINELILCRMAYFRFGIEIDYKSLVERMNVPVFNVYNPKSPRR